MKENSLIDQIVKEIFDKQGLKISLFADGKFNHPHTGLKIVLDSKTLEHIKSLNEIYADSLSLIQEQQIIKINDLDLIFVVHSCLDKGSYKTLRLFKVK